MGHNHFNGRSAFNLLVTIGTALWCGNAAHAATGVVNICPGSYTSFLGQRSHSSNLTSATVVNGCLVATFTYTSGTATNGYYKLGYETQLPPAPAPYFGTCQFNWETQPNGTQCQVTISSTHTGSDGACTYAQPSVSGDCSFTDNANVY